MFPNRDDFHIARHLSDLEKMVTKRVKLIPGGNRQELETLCPHVIKKNKTSSSWMHESGLVNLIIIVLISASSLKFVLHNND